VLGGDKIGILTKIYKSAVTHHLYYRHYRQKGALRRKRKLL